MNPRDPHSTHPVPLLGRKRHLKEIDGYLKKTAKRKNGNAELLHLTGAAGTGRSCLLRECLGQAKARGFSCWEFSARGQNLRTALAEALGPARQPEGPPSFSRLAEPWCSRLAEELKKGPVLLAFSDLQALPEAEQTDFIHWLNRIAEHVPRLALILEYRQDEGGGFQHALPEGFKRICLENLGEKEVRHWVSDLFPKAGLKRQIAEKLWEKTHGNPRSLMDWSFFLVQRGEEKMQEPWPQDESELIAETARLLDPIDKKILMYMALQDTWIRAELLADLAQLEGKTLQKRLARFRAWDLIQGWGDPTEFWRLEKKEVARKLLETIAPEELRQRHGEIFHCLERREDKKGIAQWLAYHASLGALPVPAFRWNLGVAEELQERGRLEEALPFLHRALSFAESDFKKAYTWGKIAEQLSMLGRFQDTLWAHREALKWAERADWPEFLEFFHLNMAQLLSHLGRYREAEPHYRKGLDLLEKSGKKHAWLEQMQNLGVALTEQARYSEALALFEKCRETYVRQKDAFGETMARIHLFQIYNSLGMTEAAAEHLQKVKKVTQEKKIVFLEPYLKLLQGKFEFSQGNRIRALRILEEAAADFEKLGDVHGKVEVLLSMSAPLLEHNFIQEAGEIIRMLAQWPELKNLPALQHSVYLRRLALGAFSGTWVASDITMASQDAFSMGRTEDWLQFWFHLALAGQKIGNQEFFNKFIQKARNIADSIAGRLEPEQRESFLKRPDVARILRLAGEGPGAEQQRLRAQRELVGEGPAEAATLAPPEKK